MQIAPALQLSTTAPAPTGASELPALAGFLRRAVEVADKAANTPITSFLEAAQGVLGIFPSVLARVETRSDATQQVRDAVSLLRSARERSHALIDVLLAHEAPRGKLPEAVELRGLVVTMREAVDRIAAAGS